MCSVNSIPAPMFSVSISDVPISLFLALFILMLISFFLVIFIVFFSFYIIIPVSPDLAVYSSEGVRPSLGSQQSVACPVEAGPKPLLPASRIIKVSQRDIPYTIGNGL